MQTNKHIGFTLVELAVVIFLIGLLASVGLSALTSQMNSASYSVTKKKQDTIKDSLIAYLGKNKRLPCPAIDGSGIESRMTTNAPANCIDNTGKLAYFGFLPYATLGLPKSAALDGWENFLSYAVANPWTLTYSTANPVVGSLTTNAVDKSFDVGDSGNLTVNDRSPATNATPTVMTTSAAVFVVSHGRNGLGALTVKGTRNSSPVAGTDEQANQVQSSWAVPSAFYQREYTDNVVPTYGAYDDVSFFLTASDLITPLIKDGALKSAESLWAEQSANIKNIVLGYMFSPSNTNCAPPDSSTFATLLSSSNIPPVDPWDGVITYTRTICRLNADGSSRPYVSGVCNNGTTSTSTNGFAFTITTPTTSITTPTINQLIATFQAPLANCP